MSSHRSTSAGTPTANLNDQLSDWWLTTVLGDTGFMTEDSESSLGWEFEMEEAQSEVVVESSSKKSGERNQNQVFSFANASSSHEKKRQAARE